MQRGRGWDGNIAARRPLEKEVQLVLTAVSTPEMGVGRSSGLGENGLEEGLSHQAAACSAPFQSRLGGGWGWAVAHPLWAGRRQRETGEDVSTLPLPQWSSGLQGVCSVLVWV